MLNCLIVEDEPPARKILENYISRTPGLQLAGSCPNAVAAYELLLEGVVDIVFLDIKLPSIDGLTFLESLKRPPAVIFTTAYSDYAVKSYELNAVDYLLKPFSYQRFCSSIERFIKLHPGEEPPAVKDYLFVKSDSQLVRIFYKDILYIEARKDYLKIVTANGHRLTHQTMKSIVSLLPEDQFIRVHRSYIISGAAISKIGKETVDIAGAMIPVGERYRAQVQEWLKKMK
jgi:DNA-binding LytR/AlgR family response regulator